MFFRMTSPQFVSHLVIVSRRWLRSKRGTTESAEAMRGLPATEWRRVGASMCCSINCGGFVSLSLCIRPRSRGDAPAPNRAQRATHHPSLPLAVDARAGRRAEFPIRTRTQPNVNERIRTNFNSTSVVFEYKFQVLLD